MKQERAVQSRLRILEAAGTLFRDKGYKATTMRDIAEAVGMQAGSIYYYFASKEEMLREVTDSGISIIDATVRQSVTGLPPDTPQLQRIRAAIRAHLHSLLQTGECPTAYARIYSQLPSSIKQRDHPMRQAYIGYWCGLIEAAQGSGEIAPELPVHTFVDFLLGSMSRAVEWHDPKAVGIDALASWIADWVLKGIVHRPAGAG